MTSPKWHRIYYLLAFFDIVVVIFGLYLNHQIISIQNELVAENQAWSQRLENYLELSEMGAMVNAPGNNVFESHDYLAERQKMESALTKFNESLERHKTSLEAETATEQTTKLRENFRQIEISMNEMTAEARQIFLYFEQKKDDLAGHRMAEMDRKFFQLNRNFADLRREVMGFQKTLLAKQASEAQFYRRFELVTAIFIMLMVMTALVYGIKIKTRMEAAANEKELFIKESEKTRILLKESQDELEQRVTERTREALQAKTLIENIFDSMADIMVTVDDRGVIQRVNQATFEILGFDETEIIGQPIKFLTRQETFLSNEEFEQMLESKKLVSVEKTFVCKNGESLPVMISSSILQGRRAAAVIVAKDISKTVENERRLRRYATKLEQSNRELEDFAYVASHDLQEPLRKVQAFGDRLQRKCADSLSSEGRDYVKRMRDAAERMQKLINDLLTFSRVTSKAQPFKSVDIRKITEEVVSDLEVRIEQTEGRIEIGELPVLDADPVQLRQLMQNLIGNALKFHRADEKPLVKIYAETAPQNGGSFVVNGQEVQTIGNGEQLCKIIVEDNGIGFDEKYLPKIFTVFQRLHNRAEYEGSGIGLAVCRKIAERHGGTITARSTPNQGSTFSITLPLIQTDKEVHINET